MAKKITIQGTNLLESLGDAWGGVNDTQTPITPYEGKGAETVVPPGKEWGVTKDEVERFIKAQLGTKVGDIRWHKPESSNYYDLLVFATKADATAWDADKTLENYIGRKQLPISAVQTDSYIATLSTSKTGSTAQAPFVVKRGEDWVVPVRLNAWHIISATGQQIFIPVTATVVVERSTNGQNWTQVRTATVSSTENESGFPNSINVGPSLDTGQDAQYQVRLRVLPFVIEDVEDPITAQAIVMYVKTVPGTNFKEVSDYIKEAVCAFDPTREPDQVNVRHLDEWIENMYQNEQSLGKLITIASIVALLIAIIGIIGLVFFETQLLRKEIAVRRVNGATVGSILQMINKKYLIMAGASFVIAAPIAYWLMTAWRKGFAYQAPVPVWIFLVALIAVAAITLAVVTLQSWRAANANPVESLKNE